jgi:hypothetical protein
MNTIFGCGVVVAKLVSPFESERVSFNRYTARSHAHAPSLTFAAEMIRQLVAERPSLLDIVRLQVGRGYPHPEVALAVFSLTEVADKRQERPDLTAGESEMNAVDLFATLFGSELPHRLQVVAPIAPADHEGGEALPIEKPPCQLGLHERADRHAGRQPPGRRANADEVVVALPRLLRDTDLPSRSAQLRREHPEDVKVNMPEGGILNDSKGRILDDV